jgi:hypothetical protein
MHRSFPFALAIATILAVLSASAAPNPALTQIKLWLDRDGPDAVNAYLYSEPGWKVAKTLFRLASRCEIDALQIVVRLMDTINASATEGNNDVLELAMGRCPERLLPMTPLPLVPQLCSVQAWSVSRPKLPSDSQMVAEIDRRTAKLRRYTNQEMLQNGQACIDAYANSRTCVQFPSRTGC